MPKAKKNIPPALDKLIDGAATYVEGEALHAISEAMCRLFEDPAFDADCVAASGKPKLSQSAMDDIADRIKERALKDIARIFKEGLY